MHVKDSRLSGKCRGSTLILRYGRIVDPTYLSISRPGVAGHTRRMCALSVTVIIEFDVERGSMRFGGG
jgi:hypothetical protein